MLRLPLPNGKSQARRRFVNPSELRVRVASSANGVIDLLSVRLVLRRKRRNSGVQITRNRQIAIGRFLCPFQPLIEDIPGHAQLLRNRYYGANATVRDAALYITSLPEPARGAEHWRPAATLLRLIGENGGCVVFARLAVMYGLREGVQPEPPEPDSSKKTTHWGKRKLKRGR